MNTRRVILGAAVVVLVGATGGRADWIAYQAQIGTAPRTIVVMTEYGTRPVPLPTPAGTQGDLMTPSLAPDGKTIAFAARVGSVYKIFTWGLDPFGTTVGTAKQLTAGYSYDEQPVWSPDGKKIAYLSMMGNDYGLFVVDAQGGEPAKVAELTRRFRLASPTWSPDLQRIAYCRDGELWVATLGQGEPAMLTKGVWYPAWSPDGARFAAFKRQAKDVLVLLDTQGRMERALVDDVEGPGQVAWSPDGKQILFKAARVRGEAGALWVVDAAGGKPQPLRSHGTVHGYVSWSRSPAVQVASAAPAAKAAAAAEAAPAARAPTSEARAVAAAPGSMPARAISQRAVQAAPRAAPSKPAVSRSAAQKRPAASPLAPIKVVAAPAASPAPAAEEPVRILSPVDGSSVRQTIRVAAAKKNLEGYVVFQVDGAFQYATTAPFEWKWDTRSIWKGDADVPTADKEYTISSIGFGPMGEREGQIQVKVKIQNGIDPNALGPDGTMLRLRFIPERIQRKKIEADSRFAGMTDVPQWVKSLEAHLLGELEQEVESVTRDGTTATLVTRLKEDTTLAIGGIATAIPEVQRSARTTAMAAGNIVASMAAAAQHRITLGEIYTKLPSKSVRVKDTWTAPMTFIVDLSTRQLYEAAGTHEIAELKWMQDTEALRIRSIAALPSFVTLPQGITLRNVTLMRDTWFAYKEHRVISIEDTVQGQAEIPVSATAGTAPTGPTGPTLPGPATGPGREWTHSTEDMSYRTDESGRHQRISIQPVPLSGEPMREEGFQERMGITRARVTVQAALPGQPTVVAPTTGYTTGPVQYKRVAYLLTLSIYDVK
jgi:Tol biopolymer transport system component